MVCFTFFLKFPVLSSPNIFLSPFYPSFLRLFLLRIRVILSLPALLPRSFASAWNLICLIHSSDALPDLLSGAVCLFDRSDVHLGTSDPYCTVTSSFNKQKFKTKTHKKTLSPQWNQDFNLYDFPTHKRQALTRNTALFQSQPAISM